MYRRKQDVERGRIGRVGGLALMLAAAACGESSTEITAGTAPEATASATAQITAPTAPAAPPGPTAALRPTGTVTLITGDRVRVSLQNNQLIPSVIPGPGRSKVGFAIHRVGDQIDVRPSDVQPLIAAGRL